MDLHTFQSSLRGKTALVDFGAIWCGPCQAMAPVIKQVAEKFKGRADVLEIDIDLERRLAGEFKIQSVPTLIFLKDGREIKRLIGLQSRAELENQLDTILNEN